MNLFLKLMSKQGKKHFDPDVRALAELTGAAFANRDDDLAGLQRRVESLERKVQSLSGLRSDGCEG